MRDLAGSCANIHARRCRPLRDPTRTHGCQRFSTGVGTDPTYKAIGCPDLGNDHLIVITNLRARQPTLTFAPARSATEFRLSDNGLMVSQQ
jgi:hypothetical protein